MVEQDLKGKNMKDLKFRAWHKMHKKYYEVTEIGLGEEFRHALLLYDIKESEERYIMSEEDEMILEQYTSRKDIDGKDIYVGDVLYYVSLGTPINNVVVVQEYGDFFTRYVRNQYVKPLHEPHFVSMHYKVIGNIHENKELLKGE